MVCITTHVIGFRAQTRSPFQETPLGNRMVSQEYEFIFTVPEKLLQLFLVICSPDKHPLKILHLIQKPQLRGAEIFACQLSNHLLELGHEVKIVSLVRGNTTLPFKGEVIQLNRPLNRRFVDWAGWKMLATMIAEFKPDVIQANAGDTLKFAVFSKIMFGWRASVVFRNANKVSDFIDTWPKWIFNRFLVSRVSHVVSVSELCRVDFVRTYSFKENKTTTVPIGVELKPLTMHVPPDLVSIFASGKILVHVASFVPEKNHAGLLRMMKQLVSQGEEVKLVLIGDGRLRQTIQQQVKDLGLTDHVFLLGYREDVLSVMSHAHAFVLPSKIEGLPGVILEAMYCRTPVIAYEVGGISEVVKPGKTGWLVKAGDEATFVHAVDEVLKSITLDAVKENAYSQVVGEYDNRVIANRFLKVYQKVMNVPKK